MRKHLAVGIGLLLLARSAEAQGALPSARTLTDEVARTLVWLVVAGLVFVAAFKVVDWTTPGDLRKQIAEGNVALAIYTGSLAIAIAIIIGHLLA